MCRSPGPVFGAGLPPAGEEPPEQQLRMARETLRQSAQTNAALRDQIRNTTQVLIRVIEAAEGTRPDKFLGCDRCSECTIRVTKIVDEWLRAPSFSNPDSMIAKFRQFTAFPRALVRLVTACLEFVRKELETPHPEQSRTLADGVFITELTGLCDDADTTFKSLHLHLTIEPVRVLYFARLAAALELLRMPLGSVLSDSPAWPRLCDRLTHIAECTHAIEGLLPDDLFRERRWSDESRSIERDGAEKRVCGGGVVRNKPSEGQPDPRPIYVIDFSRHHFLGVVEGPPVSGQCLHWEFFPCQRELPFEVDFKPVGRRDKPEYFPTFETPIKRCGQHFQLFRITRVQPTYYYCALCAVSPSSHVRHTDHRLVDTYDWPHVPSIYEQA